MTNLLQVIRSYAVEPEPPIILLENIDQKLVGAIYLDKIADPAKIVLSETNNTEKFYFYYEGTAVFFSFWRVAPKHGVFRK